MIKIEKFVKVSCMKYCYS